MLKAIFYYAVLFCTLLVGCVAVAVFFPRSMALEQPVNVTVEEKLTDISEAPALAQEAPAVRQADTGDTVTVFSATGKTVTEKQLDDFIAEVLLAELPPTFHDETLKAMAVAIRTYIRYHAAHGSDEAAAHHGAQICTDSTHCLAAMTLTEAADKLGTDKANSFYLRTKASAEATHGVTVCYDGKPINAVFHAMSYKRTEASENVWGTALPYLVSVETPETEALTGMVTTKTVTDGDCKHLFGGKIEKISTGSTGRLAYLTAGNRVYSGVEVRSMLGLRATALKLTRQSDGYEFTVYGSGHGVGMSQWGAQLYAEDGKSYAWILTHYYPGSTVTEN